MNAIIVTGAASGMGRRIAARHAAAGRRVAALDRNGEGLKELAREYEGVTPVEVDVSDLADMRRALGEALAAVGTPDRVYAAAGLGHTDPIESTPAERVLHLMAVNYGGVVGTVEAVLPRMLAAGRGHLVIFASTAGWVPAPQAGPYSATKAAVRMYAEVLHREVRHRGLTVSIVCPPAVSTPLLEDMPAVRKGLRYVPPLTVEAAVEAIERDVDQGRLWVYPGRGTGALVKAQRHAPRLLARAIDKMLA